MTDTERLAALLKELDPLAVSMDDLAVRLVAAGVRVPGGGGVLPPPDPSIVGTEYGPLRRDKSRIDPDRLARALSSVTGEYSGISDDLAAAIVKAYEEEG